MSVVGSLLGGGPSGSDVKNTMGYLTGPDRGNYTAGNSAVGAMQGPVAGQADQSKATNLIAQTAAGSGPSLARANMMAGLSSTNNAIAAQAMTNQGNIGQGVSQRNLLNAQAGANSNVVNQAGQASVAEQLGAQSNYASAANAQAQSALGARQQQLGAYGLQGAQQAAYDQGQQALGVNKANVGLQAVNADAKQLGAIGSAAGNIGGGIANAIAMSDEACKQNIQQGTGTASKIDAFLNAFQPSAQAAPAVAPSSDGLLHAGSGIRAMGGADDANYGGLDLGRLGGGLNKAMGAHSASMGKTGLEGESSARMAAAGMGLTSSNSALAALGPMAAASDERCKQNIVQPSNAQLAGFMGAMEPSTFEYKDQSYSPGQHMGVMAQDVDDSKLGAGLIEETPDGLKGINVPKALGASLASLAYLNQRIDKLEGHHGKRNA